MNDVIYRQHAINAIENTECELTTSDWNELVNSIKSVPSAQQWIPCSERMPKEDDRYLCDYGNCIDFGVTVNGEWFVSGVVAWMPLPEPMKQKGKPMDDN